MSQVSNDNSTNCQSEIKAADVKGLKYFRDLKPLLKRLHHVGTERVKPIIAACIWTGYCTLIMIWLFSPVVDSLRGLQQASELDKVRKKFGVGRSSVGSLSESVRLFDPEPLKAIAQELSHRLPGPQSSKFDSIEQTITAVDGAVINTVVHVARLAWLLKSDTQPQCAVRLHTHFEVLRGIPSRIDVTGAKPKGSDDERAVLERTIQADHLYLIDRGYAKFLLWNMIVEAGSSYVCRVRDNSKYEVLESRTMIGRVL